MLKCVTIYNYPDFQMFPLFAIETNRYQFSLLMKNNLTCIPYICILIQLGQNHLYISATEFSHED